MKINEGPIIVDQAFDQPLLTLWNAISSGDEMRQWFFEDIPDFRPELGFSTQFNVDTGERQFMHLWEVIEVQPQSKLVYSWKYEGYAGDGYVCFEISGDEKSSVLHFSSHVTEDFEDDIPEFDRASGVAGWQYFLNQRLKTYLDGD